MAQNARYKKAFLEAYLELGTVTAGAKKAGVGRRTIYNWIDKDKEFATEFEQVRESVAENLEQEAIRRAYDGSDTLLIFLLKGLKPERYRERQQLQHTGAIQHQVTYSRVERADGD